MYMIAEHYGQLTTLIDAFTNISSRLNGKCVSKAPTCIFAPENYFE